MKATLKIHHLLQEFIKQYGYTPKKVYVDDRIYNNLCRDQKLPDDAILTEVMGLKVVCRFGGPNSIDFI